MKKRTLILVAMAGLCTVSCSGGSGVNSGPALKKAADSIRSNHDEVSNNGDQCARRLTSGYLLDGKKGSVWVYTVSQAPADHDYFSFTAAVNFGSYWVSAHYSFASFILDDDSKRDYCYISVTETELSLFEMYRGTQMGYYALEQDFSNSSTVILEYYEGVADKATAEKNAVLVTDRGLSYVSSFMKSCGVSMKDLGFVNY